MLDRHECFSVFHHLQKDKQRKQRHLLKLGKKRRESSKRNYYNISPRVIIKAIIIIPFPRQAQVEGTEVSKITAASSNLDSLHGLAKELLHRHMGVHARVYVHLFR